MTTEDSGTVLAHRAFGVGRFERSVEGRKHQAQTRLGAENLPSDAGGGRAGAPSAGTVSEIAGEYGLPAMVTGTG
jgi:hypothetical protein